MAFNIGNFLDNMVGDGARPNLFDVFVPSIGGNFTFKAKATSIPSSSIGVASTFYYGRQAKFAGNRTFDNWSVTVLLDEADYNSGGVRGSFENWSSLINAHRQNVRLGKTNLGSYARNCTVVQKGKVGLDIGKYTMWGAFPIDISAVSLDWGANDTIAEFTVTFAYQWWESRAVNN